MTDRLAAVGLRVLAPRARALGPGDDDALENIDTSNLPDGALAFCSDVRNYYSFFRDGTLPPSGTTIIKPQSGPGIWIVVVTGGGSNAAVAYQIAMSNASPVDIAVPTNWSAIPNDATWIDTDSALGAGTLTPPPLWSVTGTGSGVLTYNGSPATLLFSADVSLSHASSTGETLWGIYISQNGAHLGTSDNLAREQQSSQVTEAAGTPEHLHTESLLNAAQGDFFQILIIDRGTQATLVNRAQLSVRSG